MGPGGFEPPTSRLSGVRSNQAELRAPKKTGARPFRSRRRVGRRVVHPKDTARWVQVSWAPGIPFSTT